MVLFLSFVDPKHVIILLFTNFVLPMYVADLIPDFFLFLLCCMWTLLEHDWQSGSVFPLLGEWIFSPFLFYSKKLMLFWHGLNSDLLSYKDMGSVQKRAKFIEVKRLVVVRPSSRYYIINGDDGISALQSLICHKFRIVLVSCTWDRFDCPYSTLCIILKHIMWMLRYHLLMRTCYWGSWFWCWCSIWCWVGRTWGY